MSHPDSPTPTTIPEEVGLPGFRQPPTRRPDPPGETTTWPTEDGRRMQARVEELLLEDPTMTEERAWLQAGAEFVAEPDELEPASRSTTPPPGPFPASTPDPNTYVELIGVGFGILGLFLHNRLAPGDNDLWLPQDAETEAVATPLSRIAARHTRLSAGRANDLTDGIEAGVAVVGYGVANLQRTARMRAAASAGNPANDTP